MAQRTRIQLRTEIAAFLSLNLDDVAELALIDLWIADGIEYVVAQGETKVAIATAALTAGVGDYELDDNILRILWLESTASGTDSEWQPASPTEILRLRVASSATTSPTLRYAVDGANMLMLWPIPATGDTLYVRYVPRPPALTGDDDTPSWIPAEFHPLVSLYAQWKGGDYDDDQSSAQGSRYKQLLDAGIQDMKGRITKKKGRRLPRAAVSRRSSRYFQHRNDADV